MSGPVSETVHATCVAIAGHGVLIMGPSGAGKSDLALRLIDRGAVLVSDDYTDCVADARGLTASAPERIAGLIEIHGIGIVEMPHVAYAPVALIVAIDESPARMPEPAVGTIAGVDVPLVTLAARDSSAPIKVEYALKRALEPGNWE